METEYPNLLQLLEEVTGVTNKHLLVASVNNDIIKPLVDDIIDSNKGVILSKDDILHIIRPDKNFGVDKQQLMKDLSGEDTTEKRMVKTLDILKKLGMTRFEKFKDNAIQNANAKVKALSRELSQALGISEHDAERLGARVHAVMRESYLARVGHRNQSPIREYLLLEKVIDRIHKHIDEVAKLQSPAEIEGKLINLAETTLDRKLEESELNPTDTAPRSTRVGKDYDGIKARFRLDEFAQTIGQRSANAIISRIRGDWPAEISRKSWSSPTNDLEVEFVGRVLDQVTGLQLPPDVDPKTYYSAQITRVTKEEIRKLKEQHTRMLQPRVVEGIPIQQQPIPLQTSLTQGVRGPPLLQPRSPSPSHHPSPIPPRSVWQHRVMPDQEQPLLPHPPPYPRQQRSPGSGEEAEEEAEEGPPAMELEDVEEHQAEPEPLLPRFAPIYIDPAVARRVLPVAATDQTMAKEGELDRTTVFDKNSNLYSRVGDTLVDNLTGYHISTPADRIANILTNEGIRKTYAVLGSNPRNLTRFLDRTAEELEKMLVNGAVSKQEYSLLIDELNARRGYSQLQTSSVKLRSLDEDGQQERRVLIR